MEAHPIPQNITSFEFHLVGDMTLKQFGYLAVGLSIAYMIFVVFALSYPLVAWPLIVLFSFLGFAFAFVPIGSRPLDHWLKAFLKAIYSPTKRVWKRQGQTAGQDSLFQSRLLMYLPSFNSPSSPQTQYTPIPPKPVAPVLQPTPAPAPQLLPTKEELSKTVELARQAQGLQVKIIQTEHQLTQLRSQVEAPQPSVNYIQQVNTILEELQKALNQASSIKQQLATLEQPGKSSAATVSDSRPKVTVKVVLPVKPKQTQLALTSFPNVINGIIKDGSGNYLDGAVVVIYDKESMPVRALKTNKLGQYSGSTPLPNGTYTIEAEKEGYSFDILQIELTGQLIPPLAVTAKQ